MKDLNLSLDILLYKTMKQTNLIENKINTHKNLHTLLSFMTSTVHL